MFNIFIFTYKYISRNKHANKYLQINQSFFIHFQQTKEWNVMLYFLEGFPPPHAFNKIHTQKTVRKSNVFEYCSLELLLYTTNIVLTFILCYCFLKENSKYKKRRSMINKMLFFYYENKQTNKRAPKDFFRTSLLCLNLSFTTHRAEKKWWKINA